MKFLRKAKDGGPESHVTGYWLVEIKSLFSIALLKFSHGSRESYHTHAFNAVSWVLKGHLHEEIKDGPQYDYKRSWRPIRTLRETFHRVYSIGTTWAITFRGPWSKTWEEYEPNSEQRTVLTHGRHIVVIEGAR